MSNPNLGELFTQVWQKINQMKLHVCLSGEYNVTTLVPTVDYPEENTFYLVPDGSGNNVYTEWIYANNNWERFGQASIDLSTYATKGELPTKVSDLQNDAGYLTAHQDISGKANSADLASVATSGSYNDLINKPTIPDVSNFYTKPQGGIPASDLAETYLTTHQDISGKVDKVTGKGLSTNDFTNIYKEQLDNLSSSNVNEMTTNESDVIFDEVFGDYIYIQSSTTMTSSELNDMLTDIFGGD